MKRTNSFGLILVNIWSVTWYILILLNS
jgi:hypothetical protein